MMPVECAARSHQCQCQDGFKVSIFALWSQPSQTGKKSCFAMIDLFRYGQTGSGKTYTMQGSSEPGALGHDLKTLPLQAM